MNNEVRGKAGITAQIVADSVSPAGKRITTYQLRYPRIIHAEFMTHRLFSRNASSTRAVPIKSISSIVEDEPFYPMIWGANKAGMQSDNLLASGDAVKCQSIWKDLMDKTITACRAMSDIGLHKQWAGRPLEPFSMMNTILTTTEKENWNWLRRHSAAQPEIQELANIMYQCDSASTPLLLNEGEWHLPFITTSREGDFLSYSVEDMPVKLEDAKRISASACAQVSYRKNDLSLSKANDLWDRLIESEPVHASPIEHQATPIIEETMWMDTPGITHVDRAGKLWSGNFQGWIQHRQLIPNNSKW